MRIQYMNLISKDNTTAVIEVFGLSKKEPHKSTSLTGTFVKNPEGVWKLSSINN